MIKLKDIIGLPSLQYHVDNRLSLHENVYRYSSNNFISLFTEARDAWRDGLIELNAQDINLIETTDIGLYGEYNGQRVPLDLPMLDEQGADTSWEDEDGNKITLEDILDMTKNVPQKDYPTEKLAKIVLNWDNNPEEVERIDQVEISKQYPILIMADEAGKIQWILDGNHRAQKALRSKSETIPAKIIKPSMLDAKSKKVLLDIPMLEGEVDYEKEKTWKIQDKFPIKVTARKGWSGNYYTIKPKPMNISYDAFMDLGSGGNVAYTSYDYTTGEALWTSDSLEQIKQWEEDNQDKIKVIYPNNIRESYDYDEVAQSEFGMDYDQLGSGEKEWVRDEIDNMSMNEDRKYNQEELLRLDLIARRRFDCDYEKCNDDQKTAVLKDKSKVGVKEAKYKGKDVPLNKPKRGGSKKFFVYTKNKKGNVVKVSFGGTTGLSVKIKEKGARASFAARHKCATKKDKTKPGYWSCNVGRYWKSLGGAKNFSGYW